MRNLSPQERKEHIELLEWHTKDTVRIHLGEEQMFFYGEADEMRPVRDYERLVGVTPLVMVWKILSHIRKHESVLRKEIQT